MIIIFNPYLINLMDYDLKFLIEQECSCNFCQESVKLNSSIHGDGTNYQQKNHEHKYYSRKVYIFIAFQSVICGISFAFIFEKFR